MLGANGLPYELCNKCFTYNPEVHPIVANPSPNCNQPSVPSLQHFHSAHDEFIEIGSEENKLRR